MITLLDHLETMKPSFKRNIKNISYLLIDYIVKKKGQTTLEEIENYSGLTCVTRDLTANLLRLLAKGGLIRIHKGVIIADVDRLKKVKEQTKTKLPENHNKLWSEEEYVKLAEMYFEERTWAEIAIELKRTEGAVKIMVQNLRKTKEFIPIIERHAVVRAFVNVEVSPKPTSNLA